MVCLLFLEINIRVVFAVATIDLDCFWESFSGESYNFEIKSFDGVVFAVDSEVFLCSGTVVDHDFCAVFECANDRFCLAVCIEFDASVLVFHDCLSVGIGFFCGGCGG